MMPSGTSCTLLIRPRACRGVAHLYNFAVLSQVIIKDWEWSLK